MKFIENEIRTELIKQIKVSDNKLKKVVVKKYEEQIEEIVRLQQESWDLYLEQKRLETLWEKKRDALFNLSCLTVDARSHYQLGLHIHQNIDREKLIERVLRKLIDENHDTSEKNIQKLIKGLVEAQLTIGRFTG